MSGEDRPRRRVPVRWVTLAEAIALATVAIAGLGLYNGWNRERQSSQPAAAPAAKPLNLKAVVEQDGGRLTLSPVATSQVIEGQTIAFPTALKVAPVETTGDPRIEADWIDRPLRKAMENAPKAAGDRSLPVLVTSRYLDGDIQRTDVAAYRLGYAIEEGGLFGGGRVRLRGLALIAHGVRDGQRRLDAMWKPAGR